MSNLSSKELSNAIVKLEFHATRLARQAVEFKLFGTRIC